MSLIKYICIIGGFLFFFQKSFSNEIIPCNGKQFSWQAKDQHLINLVDTLCSILNIKYIYTVDHAFHTLKSIDVKNKNASEVLNDLCYEYDLHYYYRNKTLHIYDFHNRDQLDKSYQVIEDKGRVGFHFSNDKKSKKDKVRIPVEIISNLIILPLKINNSETLNFILDSGVKSPILLNVPEQQPIVLHYTDNMQVRGLGGDNIHKAYRTFNNQLVIGENKIIGNNQSIAALIDNNISLDATLGKEIHGIIGYTLFQDFTVSINYVKEEIVLHKKDTFEPNKRDCQIPLNLLYSKPIIDTKLFLDDKNTLDTHLLIDLGASETLWISTLVNEDIKIPDSAIKSPLGRGFGGQFLGYKARISKLGIGDISITSPVISFVDNTYIKPYVGSQRHGSIGGELLKRMHITLDYSNKVMYLRPNSNFRLPFPQNISGLEIVSPFPGYPVYEVSYVVKDSPSYFAGIGIGDLILEVNNKPTGEYDFQELYKLIKGELNNTIHMKLQREGQIFNTKFKLTRSL